MGIGARVGFSRSIEILSAQLACATMNAAILSVKEAGLNCGAPARIAREQLALKPCSSLNANPEPKLNSFFPELSVSGSFVLVWLLAVLGYGFLQWDLQQNCFACLPRGAEVYLEVQGTLIRSPDPPSRGVVPRLLSYTTLNIGFAGLPVPSGNFTGTMRLG